MPATARAAACRPRCARGDPDPPRRRAGALRRRGFRASGRRAVAPARARAGRGRSAVPLAGRARTTRTTLPDASPAIRRRAVESRRPRRSNARRRWPPSVACWRELVRPDRAGPGLRAHPGYSPCARRWRAASARASSTRRPSDRRRRGESTADVARTGAALLHAPTPRTSCPRCAPRCPFEHQRACPDGGGATAWPPADTQSAGAARAGGAVQRAQALAGVAAVRAIAASSRPGEPGAVCDDGRLCCPVSPVIAGSGSGMQARSDSAGLLRYCRPRHEGHLRGAGIKVGHGLRDLPVRGPRADPHDGRASSRKRRRMLGASGWQIFCA